MVSATNVDQKEKFRQDVTGDFMRLVSNSATQRSPIGKSAVSGYAHEYILLGRLTNPNTGATALFLSHATTWAAIRNAVQSRCRVAAAAFLDLGDCMQTMLTAATALVNKDATEAQLIEYMTQLELDAYGKREHDPTRPLGDDALSNAATRIN